MMEAEILPHSTGSRYLLQWVLGLQQRRRRLFVLKTEIAAKCPELAGAGPEYVCVVKAKFHVASWFGACSELI